MEDDLDMEDDLGMEDNNPFTAGMGEADPQAAFSSLSQRYTGLLGEQRAARQQAEVARAERFKIAEEAIRQQRFGAPTTSQQLAALSQALIAPRRMRGFAGTLDNILPALTAPAGLRAEAETKREAALRQLREQYATAGETAMLAGLEGEREAMEPLLRTYGALAKPRVARSVGTQVVGGKVVAVMQDPDSGDVYTTPIGDAPQDMIPVAGVTAQGQPVFRSARGIITATGEPVTQFDPKETKPREPSTAEMREIFKTEDYINSASDGLYTLQKALALNEQALEGSLSGFRKTLGQLFSSDDPQYVATEEFDNLQLTAAMQKLKTTFGGNISDGERTAITALEAVSKYPRAARARIIQNGLDAVQRILARQTKRLEDLKTGQYSQYQQPMVPSGNPLTPPSQPRVRRFDVNGKRIQ